MAAGAAGVERQRKRGLLLLHVVLVALLVSQASQLFETAWARGLEADRKSVAAADEVTNQLMNKETKTATTKDPTMRSNYYGGGDGGYSHGGGGYSHGGGGYGHGGGGYGHGSGGYGHGGSGWEHRNEKKP